MMLCDKTVNLRLSFQVQLFLVLKRFKKYFASLHTQDRKLFCFPNTSIEYVSTPQGMKVCKSLEEFQIKTLKGGFRRRPELLMKQDAKSDLEQVEEKVLLRKWSRMTKKNHRIQEELVEKAINLIHDIKITSNTETEKVTGSGNNQLVLDIGCGDGTSSVPLLGRGYSCIGIDLNLESLSEFKHYISCTEQTFHDTTDSLKQRHDFQSNNLKQEPFQSRQGNNLLRRLHTINYTSMSNHADVVRWDLRHGLPFKPNSFDLAISISFLQWLFYGEKQRQLNLFFSSLKSVLCPNRTAVIQFYPRNSNQMEDAVQSAGKYFQGVVVGDYPHIDRGRKLFLVLFS